MIPNEAMLWGRSLPQLRRQFVFFVCLCISLQKTTYRLFDFCPFGMTGAPYGYPILTEWADQSAKTTTRISFTSLSVYIYGANPIKASGTARTPRPWKNFNPDINVFMAGLPWMPTT